MTDGADPRLDIVRHWSTMNDHLISSSPRSTMGITLPITGWRTICTTAALSSTTWASWGSVSKG